MLIYFWPLVVVVNQDLSTIPSFIADTRFDKPGESSAHGRRKVDGER